VGMEMKSVGKGGDGYNFCPYVHVAFTFASYYCRIFGNYCSLDLWNL